MKKWIALIAFSAVCAVMMSFLKIEGAATKKVIYLKGGEPVLADSVSQSDQFVIYDADGKHGMFMKDDVTSVGTLQVQKRTSLLTVIDRAKRQAMLKLGFNKRLVQVLDSRFLVFIVVLGAMAGVMKLARLLVLAISNPIVWSPAQRSGVISIRQNHCFHSR